MKKNYKKSIFFVTFIILASAAGYIYFFYGSMQKEKQIARDALIQKESRFMKERLSQAIVDKQKAINAIAISLVFDSNLSTRVAKRQIPENYAKNLTADFGKYSNYKNIWLALYDKNNRLLYRSWSDLEEQELLTMEKILHLKEKKIVDFIDVDSYDLCLNTIMQLRHEQMFVGTLLLKAHFNSIAKELQNHEIESVVLVDKIYKKRVQHPFTGLFLGDYYIANKDANPSVISFLKQHGIETLIKKRINVIGDRLLYVYPLTNPFGKRVGYYIMVKDISKMLNHSKVAVFGNFMQIAFVFLILAVLAIFGYESYLARLQKQYYKSIIDTSENIIIITDGKKVVDVNRRFLTIFGFESLKDFAALGERCLQDYFIEEDGYLHIEEEGEPWFMYVLHHPNKKHKVKININGKVYYFLVSVSEVESKERLYSIVMADITTEEIYRLELEKTAITDPLTGIPNRRFFQEKLNTEIILAERYGRPFSLVLLDIDHFKKINDKYGHDMGDKVLVEFTNLVSQHIREPDVFCRIGGEEFGIILPETTLDDAVRVAKKINTIVRENKNATIPITVSLGVVQYVKGESEADIYKRADNALYKAKTSGRDRVVIG